MTAPNAWTWQKITLSEPSLEQAADFARIHHLTVNDVLDSFRRVVGEVTENLFAIFIRSTFGDYLAAPVATDEASLDFAPGQGSRGQRTLPALSTD